MLSRTSDESGNEDSTRGCSVGHFEAGSRVAEIVATRTGTKFGTRVAIETRLRQKNGCGRDRDEKAT